MVEQRKKLVEFLEFFVRSLVICYLASSIVWLLFLAIRSPWYYTRARPQDHVNTLVLNILPLSLLPLAISVIIYGIFRIKLKPLEIFLSSWYVSTFEVLAFLYLLVLSLDPRASMSPRIILMRAPEFVFLSFLIAAIPTIVYVIFKKRR